MIKRRFQVEALEPMVAPVLPAVVVLYYAIGAFGVGFGIGYMVTRDTITTK